MFCSNMRDFQESLDSFDVSNWDWDEYGLKMKQLRSLSSEYIKDAFTGLDKAGIKIYSDIITAKELRE